MRSFIIIILVPILTILLVLSSQGRPLEKDEVLTLIHLTLKEICVCDAHLAFTTDHTTSDPSANFF